MECLEWGGFRSVEVSPGHTVYYAKCTNYQLEAITSTAYAPIGFKSGRGAPVGALTPSAGPVGGGTWSSPTQYRLFGSDGRAAVDFDWGHNHGAGDPHAHDWNWRNPRGSERLPGRPIKPNELSSEWSPLGALLRALVSYAERAPTISIPIFVVPSSLACPATMCRPKPKEWQ
jgi:hypothetical protein